MNDVDVIVLRQTTALLLVEGDDISVKVNIGHSFSCLLTRTHIRCWCRDLEIYTDLNKGFGKLSLP